MAKDVTLTIRVDQATKDRLETVAKQLNRSKSYVAGEAIAEYIAVQEWQVARTKAAMRSMDAGEGIPHEEVRRWVESWGTDHELPKPVPPKHRK